MSAQANLQLQAKTLTAKYLPKVKVCGSGFGKAVIQVREYAPKATFFANTSDNLHKYGPYQVVFAMSVLCRLLTLFATSSSLSGSSTASWLRLHTTTMQSVSLQRRPSASRTKHRFRERATANVVHVKMNVELCQFEHAIASARADP